jgi:hypothetical protein
MSDKKFENCARKKLIDKLFCFGGSVEHQYILNTSTHIMNANVELLKANLKFIGAALTQVSAKSFTITYRGSGDSGDVYDSFLTPDSASAPGEVAYQESTPSYAGGKRADTVTGVTSDFETAIAEIMWQAIDAAGRTGFENNEGGEGSLTVYASGFSVLKHSDNLEGDADYDERAFDANGDNVPFASSLKRLAAALKDAGFSSVHGEYTGSGDSGDGFDITYIAAEGKGDTADMDPPGDVTYETVNYQWNAEERRSVDVVEETTADFESAFEDLAFAFIESVMGHRGWENNEGGGGEVTLTAEGVLSVEHYDNGEEDSEANSFTWNDELATDEEREHAESDE